MKKELHRSIKTNKLVIDISDRDYCKINTLIKEKRKKYNFQMKKIIQNEEKFDKIKAHNLLVKEIIMEVLDSFDVIDKYNVCVFVTGSFARCTNKINSDLDLHFCYKNRYKNVLFRYEEMIYYILFSIFDMNRAKVHNMILSRIENVSFKDIKTKIDNNSLEIVLKNKKNEINYKVDGNLKKRIYSQYLNEKNIKVVYSYLKKEILSLNMEWAHNFYVFTNKVEFLKYYDKLLLIEKRNNCFNKIDNRKEEIRRQIKNINNMIENIDKENMRDFKKLFQMEEFKLLYNYISYKRDIHLLYNDDEWKFIDFLTIDKYMENDIILQCIKDYICSLFDIVEPFKNNYSIHKDNFINSNFYELQRNELLKINKTIGDALWKE